MTSSFARSALALPLGLALVCSTAADAATVPVAADVDVLVAGGTSGAVAAAIAAAQGGASVLLVTPRNYLGDDIAGTLRLWLEPGEMPETPLAQAVYADPAAIAAPVLPFTYAADLPASPRHPDTTPPSRLIRRRAAEDPQHDSVQYDGDVTLTADLGAVVSFAAIDVVAFRRARDFEVRDVRVDLSNDGQTWRPFGTHVFPADRERNTLSIPVAEPTRFVRLHCRRAPGCGRMLLGSLAFRLPRPELEGPPADPPRPLHVKRTLEGAAERAGVQVLFGCHPTELLVEASGQPAGAVIANRQGRQAIRAKVVIDATSEALLARQARAAFRPAEPHSRLARWVVAAMETRDGQGLTVRRLPFTSAVYDLTARKTLPDKTPWFEYSLTVGDADGWKTRAELEQRVRDATFVPSQVYSADEPFLLPAGRIRTAAPPVTAWVGVRDMPLDVSRPVELGRLWVLSGWVDLPRELADRLVRPAAFMAFGERLGAAAAAEAAATAPSDGHRLAAPATDGPTYAGPVHEELAGLRPGLPAAIGIPDPGVALPVFGSYDVMVVGGGTSGVGAAIGAARHGARVLVAEALHGLGGVGTLGMIGKYWYGNRVGFAATVPENPLEVRMEFYRSALRREGADIWLGTLGCGVLLDGRRVTGVVVATPGGRGVVLAGAVIDGTGNADLAAAAGAETRFVEDFFALQTSHIPPREVGASYINGNCTPIDAADPLDVTRSMRAAPGESFDRGQIVASRERRRIVGDYTLDWLDQINERTFADAIALGTSDYDSHGYQVHPFFMLRPARPPENHRHQFRSYVPYRCLLPRGFEGILVVGLGLSAHRDAMPIVRMQPDLQNIGYAAGIAAAMCVQAGTPLRQVPLQELRQRLVKEGILTAEQAAAGEAAPAADAALGTAAGAIPNAYQGLELLMAEPERAVPLLRRMHAAATGNARLAYAHALGIMGDSGGTETLLAEAQRRLDANDWEPAGADGVHSAVRLIWALGHSRDRRAVPALIAIAERTPRGDGTRLRALAVSLGANRDPAAAPALARIVRERSAPEDTIALTAACALVRCGDHEGLGRQALQRIAAEMPGPMGRLAWQVLREVPVSAAQ